MTATFKALSLLLVYPTEEVRDAMPAVAQVIQTEGLIDEPQLSKLTKIIEEIGGQDIYDLQERYVLLFDRTRSLSLHLFEHVHGEGRERGSAMVDLQELYEQHGLEIDRRELPDFLPLFLEFLSTQPLSEARTLLGETLHIVTAIKQRLKKRRSPYATVFRAIEVVAKGTADASDVAELMAAPDPDPDDQEALDDAWEDKPVTFGNGTAGGIAPGGGCPAVRDTLSRIDPGPGAQSKKPTIQQPAEQPARRPSTATGEKGIVS